VTGNTTLGGTLAVAGASTTNGITNTGNITTDTLTVNGQTNTNGIVNTGGLTTDTATVTGDLTVGGNATFNGSQITLGAANGSSTVTVPGLATGGKTKFVTANGNGTLATSKYSVNDYESALRSVDNAISSVGAMAAALSSVPNLTTNDNQYGCGAGTGVFGSAWAGAVGCVAKVGDKVWVNLAGSYTPAVDTKFGSTPTVAGRFGVFYQF